MIKLNISAYIGEMTTEDTQQVLRIALQQLTVQQAAEAIKEELDEEDLETLLSCLDRD